MVEEKCGCRIDGVYPQFIPVIALREDVLRQALGRIAAIVFRAPEIIPAEAE